MMLFWILVGVVSILGVVALWFTFLCFCSRPEPDMLVRCNGVPGTVIHKGMLVRRADGNSYVSLSTVKVGPDGWVEVPVVKEAQP